MKSFFHNNKTRLILGLVIAAVLTAAFFLDDHVTSKKAELPNIDTSSAETAGSEDTPNTENNSNTVLPENPSSSEKTPASSDESSEYVSERVSDNGDVSSRSEPVSHNVTEIDRTAHESEADNSPSSEDDSSEEYGEEESSEPEQNVDDSSQNISVSSFEEYADTEHSDEKYHCTLMINCANALNSDKLSDDIKDILPPDGEILRVTDVTFSEGDSAFSLLQRVCRENGIPLEFSLIPVTGGAYIEGINNLYELDCGNLSGWMFSINGEFPSVSCSDIKLCEGDSVAFLYTCDLGEDVGNHYRGD